MIENNVNKVFTLRCTQPDPKDPSKLSCRIPRNLILSEKESAPEELSKTSSPDQSVPGSDAVQPFYDDLGNGEHGKYESVNVLRVQIDGQDFLKILGPRGNPKPEADEIPVVQQGSSDLKDAKERFGRLNKCNDPRCSVASPLAEDRDVPIKRDTTVEKGGKSCTLPGRRNPVRANQTNQDNERP